LRATGEIAPADRTILDDLRAGKALCRLIGELVGS
jgi:hypothetical protein